MIDNEDVLDFIRLLNHHEARYLLVGGYAVIHYTEPRFTKDVDFYTDASRENAARIVKVLTEFGIPENSINLELFSTEENFFKLGRPPWRIDLITSLKGVNFNSLYENSQEIKIKEHAVRVVAKADLIRIKKIAGRPQDLIDVDKLEK